MLWLALVFPKLPLESQSERHAARLTAVGAMVIECGHVCVVDDAAEAAGVMPGMRFSTARSMLPEGRVVERDEKAIALEKSLLASLACFAGTVTPVVCLTSDKSLLLEIGACLRLFGGISPIVRHLREGFGARGVTVQVGIAPTPRAAEWLAQVHGMPLKQAPEMASPVAPQACCLTLEALPSMLDHLPLHVLSSPPDVVDRLRSFGARTIGQALAFPRAGLARRVGCEAVDHLLQALGEIPDPRAPLRFPEAFHQTMELPSPAGDAAMLTFPARRLIEDFCGWLAVRQSGAFQCRLVLTPEQRRFPAQPLALKLSTASRDPARFLRILRERLERLPLLAPLGDMALEARGDDVIHLPGENASLLDKRRPSVPLEELIERLRARLGEAAVHGLKIHPDHRPERATGEAAIGFSASVSIRGAQRPLHLFSPPEPLEEIRGGPARLGRPFDLLTGPERIESGWWDEGDVRRDYFVARSAQGEHWWIFRDSRGWWGQGIGFAVPMA